MSEKPLIIGIHGLANKPKKKVLSDWWERSINEGLLVSNNITGANYDFQMVYWADQLYKHPLHRDKAYRFDKLYNNEPYEKAVKGTIKSKKDGFWDDLAAGSFDLTGEAVDLLKSKFGFNALADFLLGKLLKDLALYYQDEAKRKMLRDVLKQELLAAKDRNIMLVAHSMGTIIAYDVLTLLGQTNPDFEISHFVTIGSPLGIPHVKERIVHEYTHRGDKNERVRTPTVVRNRWVNFADRKDPVALDAHLKDDFKANKHGVRCEDDLIYNDYRIEKPGKSKAKRNHHKSYGYLRTPEFSELVAEFL